MTNFEVFARIIRLMFYVLAIVVFLAGCVIAVGFAGRGPREDHEQPREKKP